ncbi:MAG: hypothetical protein ABSB24_18560 [Gaiellaceae bacterium]|jgi:hypothetical protein
MHLFWYALVYNLIIIYNLAAGRVSREKLDWHDQFVSAVRNGASAVDANERRRGISGAERAARRVRRG